MELMHRLQVASVSICQPASRDGDRSAVLVEEGLSFLFARGFTAEMLRRWEVVWDPDMKAVEIPYRDVGGKFLGRIWRMPEGQVPKYRHDPGFPRSKALFGFASVTGGKEVVLTEGPLDAIWLQEAGQPGLAMLGAYPTGEQMRRLVSAGFRSATLCFDNDAAGMAAVEMAVLFLRKAGIWVYRASLPSQYKDIQEVPLPQVGSVIANRHLCINGAGLIPHAYRRWLGEEFARISSSPWRY